MRRYGVVIKLLAAAAAATASAPAPELPLALCEDIEVIDTKLLTKPPKRGDEPLPELLMDFLNTYAGEQPDTYAGTWISGAISRKWRHKTAALEAAVSRIRANLASRSTEAAEGERIPRAKFIAVLEDFYRRANPDKVANAGTIGWMIDYYEGCEELLYERLEQRYESVPGGPFKVWRTGPPFPAPEAAEPEF